MAIELMVQLAPDAEPLPQRFDQPVVSIGRDPTSLLRFDMRTALEVSTRHAEIQERDGEYVIVDRGSTNGTWVNGGRVTDPRVLHEGDVINIGRRGPEIRVTAVNQSVWHPTLQDVIRLPPLPKNVPVQPHRTSEWVPKLLAETRSLRLIVTVAVVGTLGLFVAGWLYVRSIGVEDAQIWREVTIPAIRKANDDAVVLIETTIPGPCRRGCEGTGFAITASGLVVTNRHVVIQKGVRATALRLKFANTREWLPASLVRVSPDSGVDLALLQIQKSGRYPAVVGISDKGADLPIGSAVMTIGFPRGTSLRMIGSGDNAVVATTTTEGALGKVLTDMIQIDATADHGSSGSPVFDRHGHAIGVVSGAPRDDIERFVYVVPAQLILGLTSPTEKGRKY